MITNEVKVRIAQAMQERRGNYASDAKFAVALGINSAQMSRIKNGETEGVLSDAKWLTIARKLDVQITAETEWRTARTPVFTHIYAQLMACQEQSLSALLCDNADIGKTYAARQYVKDNRFAAYVDCSQCKTKYQMVRAIAKEFGVGADGRYADTYRDLVFYLKSIVSPIIILDEAGDLAYSAFLELKALWNATEGFCGWYMMGADGLRKKIESNIIYKKVGYCELFSRFGNRYQRVTPEGRDAFEDFQRTQAALVAKANRGDVNVQQVVAKTGGSLRRVRIELRKYGSASPAAPKDNGNAPAGSNQ